MQSYRTHLEWAESKPPKRYKHRTDCSSLPLSKRACTPQNAWKQNGVPYESWQCGGKHWRKSLTSRNGPCVSGSRLRIPTQYSCTERAKYGAWHSHFAMLNYNKQIYDKMNTDINICALFPQKLLFHMTGLKGSINAAYHKSYTSRSTRTSCAKGDAFGICEVVHVKNPRYHHHTML